MSEQHDDEQEKAIEHLPAIDPGGTRLTLNEQKARADTRKPQTMVPQPPKHWTTQELMEAVRGRLKGTYTAEVFNELIGRMEERGEKRADGRVSFVTTMIVGICSYMLGAAVTLAWWY